MAIIHQWLSNQSINLLVVNVYKNPKLYTSIFCRKPSYNWHFKRPVNSVLQFQVNTQQIFCPFPLRLECMGQDPVIRVKFEWNWKSLSWASYICPSCVFEIHGLQSGGLLHSTGLACLAADFVWNSTDAWWLQEAFPAFFNMVPSWGINGLNALEGGDGGGVEAQKKCDSPVPCKPYTAGLGE